MILPRKPRRLGAQPPGTLRAAAPGSAVLSRLKGILAAHSSVPAVCTCTAITLPCTAWPGCPAFKCKLKIPSLQLCVPRQGRAPRSPSTEPSALQPHGPCKRSRGSSIHRHCIVVGGEVAKSQKLQVSQPEKASDLCAHVPPQPPLATMHLLSPSPGTAGPGLSRAWDNAAAENITRSYD